MDPKELFARSVDQTLCCLKHLDTSQLDNKTPCSEWNVKALLNHMVNELRWVPELLAGKTVKQVGSKYDGDLLGSDPESAWQHATDSAITAVMHADLNKTVHLSYGDVKAGDYIHEIGGDVLIHTWDLAQAMNCSLIFADDLATELFEKSEPRKEEFARSGLFGKNVVVRGDASLQDKLLALFGRNAPEIS